MSVKGQPTVLAFVPTYLPGYKSGGPIRSVANLVRHLGKEISFKIVTSDRDALDKSAYDGVIVNKWNRVGNADVYYAGKQKLSLNGVRCLLRETEHDVLYLNSFFDTRFTTFPLVARRVGLSNRPVVLAPRGEFSPGALGLKVRKKQLYLASARFFGLYRDLTWQASSEDEANDIRRVMGGQAIRVEIARNLPGEIQSAGMMAKERNKNAPLKVAFVSRISPMKNLDYALRVLRRLSVSIEFTIAGPMSDKTYWRGCQALINKLPDNIAVKVLGSVDHNEVPGLIGEHDLLFLPTKGENYGHVIAEALAVGTPVLTSDRTHWCQLKNAGVGWDLPLESEARFVAAIEGAAAKGDVEYAMWRQRVLEFAHEYLKDPAVLKANRQLFYDIHQSAPQNVNKHTSAKC